MKSHSEMTIGSFVVSCRKDMQARVADMVKIEEVLDAMTGPAIPSIPTSRYPGLRLGGQDI